MKDDEREGVPRGCFEVDLVVLKMAAISSSKQHLGFRSIG
jgi:hypothetical protein